MAFGVDGSIYLSDGAFVRKVAMDGTVTTVGSGLDFRESADQPRFRHPVLRGAHPGRVEKLVPLEGEEAKFVTK